MSRWIEKYVTQYLSFKVVFLLDFVLFAAASFLSILFLNVGTDTPMYGEFRFILIWMFVTFLSTFISMFIFKCYRVAIRHTTLHDILKLSVQIGVKEILSGIVIAMIFGFTNGILLTLASEAFIAFVLLVLVRGVMLAVYDFIRNRINDKKSRKNILVYGIGDKSAAVVTRLSSSPHYKVVGFVVDEKTSNNINISDFPVYQYKSDAYLSSVISSNFVDCILFATNDDLQSQKERLLPFCAKNSIQALLSPTIDEVVAGRYMKNRIRQVKIEDLLGRQEIKISLDEIRDSLAGKVVMVTGAAGSIGSELCRQIAGFGIRKLILFDNAETPMHNLRLELEERFPHLDFIPIVGDVRLKPRLDFAFRSHHPQIVFHAAAYKHVPLMEENPCEAVLVNVAGSRNIADKCIEYEVEKMVMISTDKAVNPTNIMGCTKRLAEIYVQSLGLAISRGEIKGNTTFVTTRFGNVLGSNGSVIPRFREQIEKGGPVTVTDPRITRFFMTIPEACRLVLEAAVMSCSNQIFVFDMGQSVKIDDLARKMIELAGLQVGEDIDIEYTGLRPGEKLYEEVLSDLENTLPTSHDRIRIADVRSYEYSDAAKVADELEELSRAVNIPDMVYLMKKTVPEFKSKNSRFEEIDALIAKEVQ